MRGSALCADVSSVKGAFAPLTLWVEFVGLPPERLIPNGDAFVPALLWPAMKLGEPLAIDAGVSTELYENLPAIQTISAAWIPGVQRAPVEMRCRANLSAIAGSALFFSCGVNSFHSLLKHPSSLTHLICAQGFDMTLQENEPFSRLFSATREVAREMGLEAVEVRTNLRAITNPLFSWVDIYAMGLAMVGLSAQGWVGKCVFASDRDYEHLGRRTSHPALTGLWSAENLRMIQDGYELSRVEKVRCVAKMKLAMRHLRVCLVDPAAYNCGRCEKCIRTMLELRAAGALEKCETLPNTICPEDIARVRIESATVLDYYRELVGALKDSGADPRIVNAVKRAVRKGKARERHHEFLQFLDRAPGGGLRQSLDRAKRQVFSALAKGGPESTANLP